MKAVAIIWVVLVANASCLMADTIRTLDGKTFFGDAAIDGNGTITVTQLAGTQVRVPLANLLQATFNGAVGLPSLPSTGPAGGVNANWVPAPWVSQNIGSVAVLGSAAYVGGQFSINATGSDIGERADAFHFEIGRAHV